MQQRLHIPIIGRNRNIRPVYVSHTAEVPRGYVAAALEAVREVTEIAGVQLPVRYFGAFYIGDGPYQSAAWYARQSWNPQRMQLNAHNMLMLSGREPYQRRQPHYKVWITGMDLWNDTDNNRFVFGLTLPELGTIQSYRRMQRGDIPAEELLKDIVEHEVAHTFKTPRKGRANTREILGTHCTTDPCIMGRSMCLEDLRFKKLRGADEESDSTFAVSAEMI